MRFDTLPNDPIVDFLRETGLTLLQQAILRQPLHVELTPEQQRLFLTTDRSIFRRWRESYRGMQPHQLLWVWTQDAAHRFGMLTDRPASNSLVGSTRLTVEGRLPVATWRSRVIEHVERENGNISLGDMPFALWGWLGDVAWLHPAFVAESTTWVETHLQTHALFALGNRPHVQFAPQTYWLLLGLACTQVADRPFDNRLLRWLATRRWGKRLAQEGRKWGRNLRNRFQGRQPRIRALRHCETICEQYGLADGWATGWDRWVLLEALRYWRGDRQASRLYTSVRALDGTSPLTKPDWQTEMPNWFDLWWQKWM